MIGASLDRNGLRPARYYVTKDEQVILASEVGVIDIPPENIVLQRTPQTGPHAAGGYQEGRIISDEEIKQKLASEHPYRDWLNKYQVQLAGPCRPQAGARSRRPTPRLCRSASRPLATPMKT